MAKNIILENSFIKFELSPKDATVLSIKTADGVDVLGEQTAFFSLIDEERNEFKNKSLKLENGVFVLDTEIGKVEIAVEISEDHFVFEVLTSLPEKAYCLLFAHARYEYDLDCPTAVRGAGVAMTVSVDPHHFPDGVNKETVAKVYEHLEGAKGAKYGLAVVPENILRETLKEICSKIDPQKGIVLKTAGPWSFESENVQGSYSLTWDCRVETLEKRLPTFKFLGIDHLDILHNDVSTFRQGDFKYVTYKDDEDFKKNVTDRLAEHGIQTGFHTYAQYINPKCTELLSNPEYQKMLSTVEEFTLAEDISEDADFIPTVESTAELSDYYGFFTTNMPYLLIGEEIVKYSNDKQGFAKCVRGFAGKKAAHKKGEKIYHLDGCFYFLVPKHPSELFLKIAHDTAEAYNKGGYTMLYIDAIDGTRKHCKIEERPYYIAKFVHEILKYCNNEPIVELSDMPASVWACRSRMGAWDIPFRNYKKFNQIHHEINAINTRHFYNSTLGWLSFYPTTEKYPGNQHTKYFHWDAIDHMGALSIMYNYSNAFSNCNIKYAGLRRNVELYKFYDKLRRDKYFSESTLEKARQNPHELAVEDMGDGKYAFVEKNYEIKRLYDVGDEKRNTADFVNPFKKQTPFIRIEACMSTRGQNPFLLLPMNEEIDVSEQVREFKYTSEINMMDNLAMKVRVKGNGKKGAVALLLRAATQSEKGYGIYIIDTDFTGWRDFVLLEADNGDRQDLPFEDGWHQYRVYRSGLNMDRINSVELRVAGDVEGVRMSNVTACQQVYDVIKNPTVKIGDETVMFECELKSTDFIEWDGKEASVLDRNANKKNIYFSGNITAPKGKFKASVGYQASLNDCPVNVYLTVGTKGKYIK